jgi:hypothetical protein
LVSLILSRRERDQDSSVPQAKRKRQKRRKTQANSRPRPKTGAFTGIFERWKTSIGTAAVLSVLAIVVTILMGLSACFSKVAVSLPSRTVHGGNPPFDLSMNNDGYFDVYSADARAYLKEYKSKLPVVIELPDFVMGNSTGE